MTTVPWVPTRSNSDKAKNQSDQSNTDAHGMPWASFHLLIIPQEQWSVLVPKWQANRDSAHCNEGKHCEDCDSLAIIRDS